MNITTPLEQEVKAPLPQLIKQSSTYKLFVPRKVEEKIRYLIKKFPHTEWSGILFIRHTGTFEDNNLEIHCEDIYPMDLGTSGWTEFRMSEDVAAYMAENIELFECDLSLVHSHHQLGAFFSDQDLHTLQSEGNDTNNFVSLIVDTKGTYVAAITRKVQTKKRVTTEYLGSSYQFFGEGERQLTGSDVGIEEKVDTTAIEYFMLDVEREVVDNPLEYLDKRFDEIEAKKKATASSIPSNISKPLGVPAIKEEDEDFYNWIHSERKRSAEAKENLWSDIHEPTIWDSKTMKELEVKPSMEDWEPDADIIHHLVCQMITCSFIINKDIDLLQWITKHMKKKYMEIFGIVESTQFNEWREFIVEFLINQYEDDNVTDNLFDDYDLYQSKIASALYNELCQYPSNDYIESYKEILTRYTYE